MVNQFYLTLPSNSSMDVFANNTAAQLITKLPDVLELDGEWEVALSEIHYPHAWYNIPQNACKFIVYYKSSIADEHLDTISMIPFEQWPVGNTHMTIPEGYYASPQEIVNEMKKLVREHFAEMPPDDRYGYFKCTQQHEKYVFDIEPDAILIMNELLAMLLGFDERTMICPDRYESSTIPNVNAALPSLYVYCILCVWSVYIDVLVLGLCTCCFYVFCCLMA